MVRSHKVAGKSSVKTENSQMASIGAIFSSTYNTKQLLNPWPSSSASCVAIYSWLSACLGEMRPFKDHPSTCGCLKSLKNKPQQSSLGNFQHQTLPELLVNVYSNHVMVKNVSCYCVHASWLFSNVVINNYNLVE